MIQAKSKTEIGASTGDRIVNLPMKPRCGEPCNHCGQCCVSERCPVGKLTFGDESGACPGLVLSECGTMAKCAVVLTEIENNMEPVIQNHLGIGNGCSMDNEINDCVMIDHEWSLTDRNGFQTCLWCNNKRVSQE